MTTTSAPKKRATDPLRAYMTRLSPAVRATLKELRETIHAAAPASEDVISYGIPAARLEGRVLVWYAAWKHHTSLYPMSPGMRRSNAAALKKYEMSKGTVRFPLDEPLPLALIKRLVKARAAEMRPPKSSVRVRSKGRTIRP